MERNSLKDNRVSVEKTTLISLLTILVVLAAGVFAGYYYLQKDFLSCGIFAFISIAASINYIIYGVTHNERLAFLLFAPIPIPALVGWQINGGIMGAGMSYQYLYLTFLFFLMGKTNGLLFVAINLLISVSEFLLQQLGYLPKYYTEEAMITYYFGYVLMAALLYIYQISKDKAQTALRKQSEVLAHQGQTLQIQKEELEANNAKDDAILESVGDGLLALDKEGRVMFMNESVHSILGWAKEELYGKVWADMVPLQDGKGVLIEKEKRPFTEAFTKGQKVNTSYKYHYVRKDKTSVPVSITASPITLNGKTIGVIEVFRDVTKEHDVDRMKTEFISLASHQLRTPLSAMKWNLEMLLAGDVGDLSQEQKQLTKNVDESNERMIGLINSLLNVSRIESGRIIVEPKPTNIDELMNGVVKEIEQKVKEKKQKLVVSVNKNLPEVMLDQQLIRQVYINLLTNAIKYTPEAGEITVFVSQKDNEIISQVSDNGYGIPAKDKNKLFEKFYRGENITKKVTDGNGLGMYLVKAIISSSGGKIWFETNAMDESDPSQKNHGTTFWFSLPKSGMVAKKGEVVLD